MRLSNVILVLSLGGVGATGAIVGCGSDTATATGGTSTTGGGGSASTSTGSDATSGGDPCSPGAQCPQVASSKCISLADNSAAKQFTLRMANLTLTAPPALTKGLVKGVVQNGVTMNLAPCNLNGGGTFSWLLQFDTATGMIKTGGGKPADDPTKGYSFVDETIMQGGKAFKIAPFTAPAPITGGKFAIVKGQDVIVPVYLDLKAMAVVLLPLHAATLTGTISPDNDCIGQYNSKGLDPAGGCLADDKNPSFIGADGKADSDGKLDGFITLEEADTVIVDAVGQSLCVILSGDAATYGDGGMPAKCKRDAAMKINFQGDWCQASNDMACKDSVRLQANFSASGVKSPAGS
ncbi:MAG: hypothetical protein ABJE95_21825 [Byssovorax sp.]